MSARAYDAETLRERQRRDTTARDRAWDALYDRHHDIYIKELRDLDWMEFYDEDAMRYRLEMNRRGLTMPRRRMRPIIPSWAPPVIESTPYGVSDKKTLRRFAAIWECE